MNVMGWLLENPEARVVIQANRGFGDLVCDSVLFRALTEHAPSIRLVPIVRSPAHAELLGGYPGIDDFLYFDADGWNYARNAARLAWRIRRLDPDVFISSVGNDVLKSPLLGWVSGARYRIGETGGLGKRLYTHGVEVAPDAHKVHGNRAILRAIGIHDLVEPWIPRTPGDRIKIDSLAAGRGPAVALHAGSRRIDEFKRWPTERFAELAETLGERGYHVILVGTQDEASTNAAIQTAAPRSINMTSRLRPRELAELLSRCAVVVGNDSGPMHMAAAVGAPTVTVFGPTDFRRTAPFGPKGRVVTRALSCAPCFPALRFGCGNPRCLRELSLEAVLRAVEDLLGGSADSRQGPSHRTETRG